jgi:hypothetical protein
VQPRQLRRRGAADGRQPAADPLHHGPPHLRHAGAGLAVPAGQGDPGAPQREDPQTYERAFEQAAQVLDEGDLLCIFPEGGITRDGSWASSRAA